jgi:NADPH:quinone reductase-like Zn-dependent oxidoreductase
MKAIVYHEYGGPEVLRLEEVEKPEPGDGEVLVRVRAAAANPIDSHRMAGALPIRPMTGLRRPKRGRPGVDLAGEVEQNGSGATRFRPGDAVFGAAPGAFAEYACVAESRLAAMPAGLGFVEASAIPVAGVTALQRLRDRARLQPGERLLVNGAAGGVGSFAVQIAAALGAEVTGVCSTRNVDVVRSIGARTVIDYTRDDFTRGEARYDVVLDCVGNRSGAECRRVMTRGGRLLPIGAKQGGHWAGLLLHLGGLVAAAPFVPQKTVFFVAKIEAGDLAAIARMIERGEVAPLIDRTFPLARAADAMAYLRQGHARGKVVVTMDGDAT